MEQTLLSRQDLANRWGFKSTKVIENYEACGIVNRVPNLPIPRYSLYEIERIELIGLDVNPLSPFERVRLENKINSLSRELDSYKNKLNNVKMIIFEG